MPRSSHLRRRRSRRRPIAARREVRHLCAPAPSPRGNVQISVEQQATVAFVRIAGELDLVAVDRVEEALTTAIDGATDNVVFDLRSVSFIDLSGLRILLRTDARGRRESFAVHIVPPPPPVARLFTLTKAGGRLAILRDEQG